MGSEASENDWKGQNFKPAERSLADILNGRQGRLFIRVFDAESKLLDSIGFRYLRDLREIHLNGKPYSAETILMPPPLGHPPAALQFIGADGTTIQPVITGDKNHATVQEGGNVIVAPHPEADKISFKLLSGTSHIDTAIELPRIWWQMKRDDDKSDGWRDTPWSMQRLEFRRYANERRRIRLRLPPQITSIHVGFDKQLERVYPSKRETVLCLAEFSDYSHIDQRLNTDAWLNVQCGEAIIALIRVFADPVPRINSFSSEPATVSLGEKALLQWATQNSESCLASIEPDIGSVALSGNISVTLTKTTTFMLRLTASGMDDVTTNTTVTVRYQLGKRFFARVKRKDGSFRRGKGFSRGEIRTAGLTHSDAARRSLPIDKRRRSTHQANVDTIRGVDNDASRKRGPTVERHNTTAL
ncbi:MAG: hypothetical protein ERJ69_03160 [Aphanocapsa feldmannii 288cV]|nr:MAG: hypothetical protein ERJ69_03160 [Aphanocapsa feldmannii 288cV]